MVFAASAPAANQASFYPVMPSHDLTGQWILKIEDQSHKVITTLTVGFTSEEADSCIAGKWLQLKVVSGSTTSLSFYPVLDSLAYAIEEDQLTIGRNGICDDYLMLSGSLNDYPVRGSYYGLGKGGSLPFGYFTLSRKTR